MTKPISPASEITMVSETLVWPFIGTFLSEEFDPKSPALRYQTERVKRILKQGKPVTSVQADQIQLYWNQSMPAVPYRGGLTNEEIPKELFWLFVESTEDIDIIHNELGFNLWLREFYIDGVYFLSPKLKRHELITDTYVVNMYPVIATSLDPNYETIKGSIIPYPLMDKLPVGLTLDDPLTHKIIHGNDDDLAASVTPTP